MQLTTLALLTARSSLDVAHALTGRARPGSAVPRIAVGCNCEEEHRKEK